MDIRAYLESHELQPLEAMAKPACSGRPPPNTTSPNSSPQRLAQAPKQTRLLDTIARQFNQYHQTFTDTFGAEVTSQAYDYLHATNLTTQPEQAIKLALKEAGRNSLTAEQEKLIQRCVRDIYREHLLDPELSSENIFAELAKIVNKSSLTKPILMLGESHPALMRGHECIHPSTTWLADNMEGFARQGYKVLALERSADLNPDTWLSSDNCDSMDFLYPSEVKDLDEIRTSLIKAFDAAGVPLSNSLRQLLLGILDHKFTDLTSLLHSSSSSLPRSPVSIANPEMSTNDSAALVHHRWKDLANKALQAGLELRFIDSDSSTRARFKVITKIVRPLLNQLINEQAAQSDTYFEQIADSIQQIQSGLSAQRDEDIAANLKALALAGKKTLALVGANHANGHLCTGNKSAYCILKSKQMPVSSIFLEQELDPNRRLFQPFWQSYAGLDLIKQARILKLTESPLFDSFPFLGPKAYAAGVPKEPAFDAALIVPTTAG